jgi:hypothetical protein
MTVAPFAWRSKKQNYNPLNRREVLVVGRGGEPCIRVETIDTVVDAFDNLAAIRLVPVPLMHSAGSLASAGHQAAAGSGFLVAGENLGVRNGQA